MKLSSDKNIKLKLKRALERWRTFILEPEWIHAKNNPSLVFGRLINVPGWLPFMVEFCKYFVLFPCSAIPNVACCSSTCINRATSSSIRCTSLRLSLRISLASSSSSFNICKLSVEQKQRTGSFLLKHSALRCLLSRQWQIEGMDKKWLDAKSDPRTISRWHWKPVDDREVSVGRVHLHTRHTSKHTWTVSILGLTSSNISAYWSIACTHIHIPAAASDTYIQCRATMIYCCFQSFTSKHWTLFLRCIPLVSLLYSSEKRTYRFGLCKRKM